MLSACGGLGKFVARSSFSDRLTGSQIDTILKIVAKPRAIPKSDAPKDFSSSYFSRFEGVNEAAMIPRRPPKLTARHLASKTGQTSDLHAVRTPVPPTKKGTWLDAYQHSLREGIAACSEDYEDAESSETPKSQGSKTPSHSTSGQSSSGGPEGPVKASRLYDQQGPPTTRLEPTSNNATINSSVGMEGSGAMSASLAFNGANVAAGVSFTDNVPSSDQTHVVYIPELPEIVPNQYDFMDAMDLEATLSQQLFNGEAWKDTHFMTDMSAHQEYWYNDLVDSLG